MAELRATITQSEFLSWQQYYQEAPFDDHHRFHRPAVLVALSMTGGKVRDKLDFLVPPVRADGQFDAAGVSTLEAFGVKLTRQ